MAVTARCRAIAYVLLIAAASSARTAAAQPGRTPPGTVTPRPPGNPPGTATVDGPSPPGAPARADRPRLGDFVLGGSLGLGLRGDGGFAGSLTGGMYVFDRLAFIADASLLSSDCYIECDDRAATLFVVGGGAQWSMLERLWGRGTLGLGVVDDDDNSADLGMGWTTGIGYDLVDGPRAALDVRFMVMGGFFSDVGPVRATMGMGLTIR